MWFLLVVDLISVQTFIGSVVSQAGYFMNVTFTFWLATLSLWGWAVHFALQGELPVEFPSSLAWWLNVRSTHPFHNHLYIVYQCGRDRLASIAGIFNFVSGLSGIRAWSLGMDEMLYSSCLWSSLIRRGLSTIVHVWDNPVIVRSQGFCH